MRSLSHALAQRVPGAALQVSETSQTLTHSPPLAGLWDLGRSQLHKPRLPIAPTNDDLSGVVLPGRFLLSSLVARGTFGTVYRARQLSVDRDIAVKVLNPDIDPLSQDGRLFVQEIRAVGRIDHANVVRIHQADIAPDGRLFYAMELLEGQNLQQLGAAGPLPRDRALELARQLLAGLGAAHDAGLVHADVKPANAIVVPRPLGPDGRPRSEPGEPPERLVLVDFGLARLRAPDRPAESAGGTPAYMAPEQLNEGRVDARSDLFSAALVLVTLLTGWRRPNAFALVPPLDGIDPDLREVLAKALMIDPASRYQSARELAAALTGTSAPQITQPTPILPFRLWSPLTESDRERLHGREADLATLTEYVLYRRSVIYTAPSGTGKTSLLRAGLVPRLETLGVHPVYLRTRSSLQEPLAAAIWPGAKTVAEAVAEHARVRGNRLVLVLDQLEAGLHDGEAVSAVLRIPHEADVAIVLAIREDHVARLLARTQKVEAAIPILRLPPLDLAGARAAIVGPITEARLAIEPDLLDALLADLRKAAQAIAPEMGWTDADAVYPPHLQLACSVLYEALEPGAATLTLAHYRRLGGFEAIVGEHLERVLDVELAGGRDAIARDIFVALVTTANQRAIRPESELLALVHHDRTATLAVLDILRARGLLLRVRGDGEPSWELVHDSLIPRILAWIDRRDLARRRAVELVRYHLRRSRPDTPSLLSRADLRELRGHHHAIDELDDELRARGDGLLPTQLVARSRQVHRRRIVAIAAVISSALTVAAVAVTLNRLAEARTRAEQSLRDRDLGTFTLELAPFDWDAEHLRATPVPASELDLHWELHVPDARIRIRRGPRTSRATSTRGDRTVGATLREHVEARGGKAFLVDHGTRPQRRRAALRRSCRSRTSPAICSAQLEPTLRIAVPTCACHVRGHASDRRGAVHPRRCRRSADTRCGRRHRENRLASGVSDRSNRDDELCVRDSSPEWPTSPGFPLPSTRPSTSYVTHPSRIARLRVSTWLEARAYCRFMGKELPTSEQWERAYRGGERCRTAARIRIPGEVCRGGRRSRRFLRSSSTLVNQGLRASVRSKAIAAPRASWTWPVTRWSGRSR